MRLLIVLSLLFYVEIRQSSALIEGLYCGRDNCFDLLNITRDATKQEITKAYRALAKKFHPDMARTAADRERFTEIFRGFANAYEILKDDETREDYERMLDNPDEYYTHYYRYYRHRYGPKVDVRLVILVLISVISIIQYYSQYSNYNSAISYFATVPKYRLQAQEIAREEGLLASDSPKRSGKKKTVSKQEEETIIRQIIEQKMDIKGGFEKPSFKRVLWLQMFLFPYYLFLKLKWHIRWFYKFRLNKHEYGDEEKIYLMCCYLKISRHQFDALPEKDQDELWDRQGWIKENFTRWKNEKEEEQKRKLAESGRYKAYRRYMRSGGPGQITFDPD